MAYFYEWRARELFGVYSRLGGQQAFPLGPTPRRPPAGYNCPVSGAVLALLRDNDIAGWTAEAWAVAVAEEPSAAADGGDEVATTELGDTVEAAVAKATEGAGAAREGPGTPQRRRHRQKAPDLTGAYPAPPGPAACKRPAAGAAGAQRPCKRPCKRPAGAAGASTHVCRGREGEACCFSTAEVGGRARYQDSSRQCPWCDDSLLERGLSTVSGKGNLARGLRFYWDNDKDIFEKAKARLPAASQSHWPLQDAALAAEALAAVPLACRPEVAAKLRLEPRRERQARAKAAAAPARAAAWDVALGMRQRLRAEATLEEKELYEERVAEDRARVARKFFPTSRARLVQHAGVHWKNKMSEELRGTIQDIAPNDTGLPRARASPEASALEAWCKEGSWAICRTCGSLCPRHLKEVDLRRVAQPAVAQCRFCRGAPGAAKTVADVPEVLRGLTAEIAAALELDCGPYQRSAHGYRTHSAMARLLWAEQPVEDKIAGLESRQDRRKARAARAFLLGSADSEYKAFDAKHKEFLRQNPGALEAERRRPLQAIEQPGVECALWPDLYWDSDLCETVARATDVRRLRRQGLAAAEESGSSGDEAE
ncbi:unnamed protein product, partial [Effrenium voratum]